MTLGNKADMLASIRNALGPADGARSLGAFAPPPHPGFTESPEELFQHELAKVGGEVTRIQSSNAESIELTEVIRGYLDPLLPSTAGAIVALSNKVNTEYPGLLPWLMGKGLVVLPPLAEFDPGDWPTSVTDTGKDESAGGNRLPESGSPTPDPGLMESYKRVLFDSALGITTADYAIADSGTLVLVSKRRESTGSESGEVEQHRLISLVPPIHVCLLDETTIFPNLADLITHVYGAHYSRTTTPNLAAPPLGMTFVTGPSRTGDIELTLTLGVHGPKELHVLIF